MEKASNHTRPVLNRSNSSTQSYERRRAATISESTYNQPDFEADPSWYSEGRFSSVLISKKPLTEGGVEEQLLLDVMSTVSVADKNVSEPSTRVVSERILSLDESEFPQNTLEMADAEAIITESTLGAHTLSRRDSIFRETIPSGKSEISKHMLEFPTRNSKRNWIMRSLTPCNTILMVVILLLIIIFVPITVSFSVGKESKIISYFRSGDRTALLEKLNSEYGWQKKQSPLLKSTLAPRPQPGRTGVQWSYENGLTRTSQKEGGNLGVKNSFEGINVEFKEDNEIKKLMNLPKVNGPIFYGVAYSPMNGMEPQCGFTKRDAQLDLALVSTVTNRIRNYGMQCLQTRHILDAITSLGLNLTLSMGVWIGSDSQINDNQMNEMKYILQNYPRRVFESVFIGNEALFRQDQTTSSLVNYINDAKEFAKSLGYGDLKIGTSEIGSLVNDELLQACDIIGTNIHPFFGGDVVEHGADWTLDFIKYQVEPKNKFGTEIVVTEVGWPYKGGSHKSSIASGRNFEYFLQDWCCKAYESDYAWYYFEAFDEEWKRIFHEDNNKWETEWGVFHSDRSMKLSNLQPYCNYNELSVPS